MKLVVFTPALKTSAIGRVASLVTRSLVSQGHDVVIVRSEEENLLERETHNFGVELLPWSDVPGVTRLIDHYADALIYHIGDNQLFHKGCLEWLPRFPGIVCLHDIFVGNLFQAWSMENPKEAKAILTHWYGSRAAQDFYQFANLEDFIEGTRDISPLTEWICSMASGVIAHSSWGVDRILKSCPGPVATVALAYDTHHIQSSGQQQSDFARDRFNILTIGHINSNKRAESVIRAIGASSLLRENATYRLVGAIEPKIRDKLEALAQVMGVDVNISGQVDAGTLLQAISKADVISCLRWPALEGASASAIEAMLSGKAIIVTNTGFYKEIPDGHAIKLNPETEIPSLQAALEQLYQDPQLRNTIGQSARQWAQATFSPDNYASELVKIARLGIKAQQPIAIASACVATLRQWGATESLICLEDTMSPLEIFIESGLQPLPEVEARNLDA